MKSVKINTLIYLVLPLIDVKGDVLWVCSNKKYVRLVFYVSPYKKCIIKKTLNENLQFNINNKL